MTLVPFASFSRKWSTFETVRLKATTVKPLSFCAESSVQRQ